MGVKGNRLGARHGRRRVGSRKYAKRRKQQGNDQGGKSRGRGFIVPEKFVSKRALWRKKLVAGDYPDRRTEQFMFC